MQPAEWICAEHEYFGCCGRRLHGGVACECGGQLWNLHLQILSFNACFCSGLLPQFEETSPGVMIPIRT